MEQKIEVTPAALPADDSQKRLTELASQTNRILFEVKSIFPFDLFPDNIVIDENKTTVVCREFVAVKRVFTIFHQDITGVNVFTSLFFSSLSIHTKIPETNPISIRNLKKDDAIHARRLMLGLSAATKQHINLSQIPTESLLETIENIGKSNQNPQVPSIVRKS